MIGIMCDQDVQGLARAVLARCRQGDGEDVWNELEIELYTFADLGLEPDATDAEIWIACQENNIVLLTGNRNAEGPDSLEVTIRERNVAGSLPVLTFADLRKLKYDRGYLELAAERLLEKLFDIDALRGAGRIYLP
ncbi:MAG: ACP S-malonyltransferase [Planctomycetes bacterium]|nr:ACP S-malonyltransferase [Planctomycetota bacterium]MBL7039160.1 ACP S-malonyltransferase [Pirellulaceae bacterium]